MSTPTRIAFHEAHWLDAAQAPLPGAPRRFHRWLRDPASLTRRVIGACPGRFRVQVLRQHWARPLPSEAALLGMRRGERALLREVRLQCDGRSWVFARTLIPVGSLRGRARRLGQLGSRPLGAVLFADPTTRRGALQQARLGPRHALFHEALAGLPVERPEALWGRRTLFIYAGQPLLVNEIFLPGIPEPAR